MVDVSFCFSLRLRLLEEAGTQGKDVYGAPLFRFENLGMSRLLNLSHSCAAPA